MCSQLVPWSLEHAKREVMTSLSSIFKKTVSEYDQEIPHSQTADKPMASQGRGTQQSQDAKKTNQAKQPALSLSLPHQDDFKNSM